MFMSVAGHALYLISCLDFVIFSYVLKCSYGLGDG